MSLFKPTYTDKKTGVLMESRVWWYEFIYAGKRIRESSKSMRKTVAQEAERNRRLELEKGFNAIEDRRHERIQTIAGLSKAYLEAYKLRHRSAMFAEYALGHVMRHLGEAMVVDIEDRTVKDYQTARLKEKAAPKTINEEVGFLLRLLGDHGDAIRAKLRRERSLKLKRARQVGKAYTAEEKAAMLAAAKAARSPAIYPALMLALNAGMRDAEIKGLQWERVDVARAVLTVSESKTEAGEGRTIPLNSELKAALVDHAKWYTKEEGGAPDEVIRDIAGHVSKQMLKHYSHVRMEAKRKALEGLVAKPTADQKPALPAESSVGVLQEVPKVGLLS
jgi:integrase